MSEGNGQLNGQKRGRGRPTKYAPAMNEQARKLCLLGATDADMANFFDVEEKTINNWKLEHPDFLQSIKDGKERADAVIADSLYHRAKGYSHDAVKIVADAKSGQNVQVPYVEHYPPDTTACIFWLKNRRPAEWRDRQEHTGAGGGPIQVEERILQLEFDSPDGVEIER